MAAYAALVSLMNNIEQMMSHPHLSTLIHNEHIQPLQEKAAFLLDYIEGCHNHGGGSKEAQHLERRIASAAHAAEDEIESHIVDQIYTEMSAIYSDRPLDLRQIIQDVDAIMKEATQAKRGWGLEENSTHTAIAGPLMESGETAMVGLDDELTQFLDELTGYQSRLHIISIVGMGGTGKTTLAKNIYQNSLIKEHFTIRAWASISQQYSAKEMISQLLSCIEKSTSGALGEELHKTLYGRRYLIVLDDIWSVEAWNKVRHYFPDNENGSRVVLTTRLSNVANDCGSSITRNMKLLKEDKSWSLFCEKALFPRKDDPPQLEDIGRQIVKSCKGLALSIVVIGGLLLKAPRTIGYWESVAKDIKSIPDSKEKQESLDVLSLSYSHLPPHLKPCFLYMGVFKEDSEIRISNIIKLWIGEGFIKPNGSQELEEVAEGYIKDLIDRNLVLDGRRLSDGEIGFCGIHDLLRDLSLKIAEQQEFFHVGKHNIQGPERRLIDSRFLDLKEVPLARTIIRQRYVECRKLAKYCRLLRVFERPHDELQIDFYGNVNLRYLTYGIDCREFSVWRLSSLISFAWNLQTLIIQKPNHQTLVAVAPAEFCMMRQLRHVECKTIYLPNPRQDEVSVLEKLQTLKTALNLGLCEEVCNIIPNIKTLHLKYDARSKGYDDSHIKCLCNLDRLLKLASLKLEYWPTGDTQFNEIVRFPSSRKKLSLRSCGLDWEDMPMIGSLPQLKVLKIRGQHLTKGREWRPVEEQFLHLKLLQMEYCELVDWHADSSHFPVLETLILKGLDELKEIPSDIGELPTLKRIRVVSCSVSATISAIKIKEDRLENDENDDLQIQVLTKQYHRKSFNQMLEMEGLTLNHIQFREQY